MSSSKINFKRRLAAEALRRYFAAEPSVKWEDLLGLPNIRPRKSTRIKLFLKHQREQINQAIIDVVYRHLPRDQQTFLCLKYEKNYSITQISFLLHVSPAQICLWRVSLLDNIGNLFVYNFADIAADVFSLPTFAILLFAIDQQIVYLMAKGSKIRDDEMLAVLKIKQEMIEEAYCRALQVLSSRDTSTPTRILKSRITYGALPLTELADICHCSDARVCQVLNEYRRSLHASYKNIIRHGLARRAR